MKWNQLLSYSLACSTWHFFIQIFTKFILHNILCLSYQHIFTCVITYVYLCDNIRFNLFHCWSWPSSLLFLWLWHFSSEIKKGRSRLPASSWYEIVSTSGHIPCAALPVDCPELQGPISISDKLSYCKISQSLEAARFVFRIVWSLWNLTGTSAAGLPKCLSNFKAVP